MDTRERHIKENEAHRHDDVTSDVVADRLRAEGKDLKRNSTKRINKLWLWLGVLVLVAILLWWLFTYVIFADEVGAFNGSLLNVVDTMKLLC